MENAQSGGASSTATIKAVQAFNDAFNQHDIEAVMAAMTDDCI
jgi:ketosteroid isomerase-like protein